MGPFILFSVFCFVLFYKCVLSVTWQITFLRQQALDYTPDYSIYI